MGSDYIKHQGPRVRGTKRTVVLLNRGSKPNGTARVLTHLESREKVW